MYVLRQWKLLLQCKFMPDIDPKTKQSDMACCVLNLKMETR